MNHVAEIMKLVQDMSTQSAGKIGVAITEHNRPEVFRKAYAEIIRYLPPGAELVVVDDASAIPVEAATYRFEINAGIAAAKNKCLELLDDLGCDHFFLFDSDTYPLCLDWYKPYVESPEPHLNYIFQDFSVGDKLRDTTLVYRDSKKVAYSHPRGCMLYYKKAAIDMVGGMDTAFGKWGFEHMSLSDRIFMAGLTSFRFMDVTGSEKLIYSADEHRKVITTVGGEERKKIIAANKGHYEKFKFSSAYIPFREKRNVLLTCYFTGVVDPQRNAKMQTNPDDLAELISSLKQTRLIIFTDCLDNIDSDKVEIVRVEASLSPYVQRWVSYREWLMQNRNKVDRVFCIDGTDVEVLREPDWENLGDNLWTGDENEAVGCEWMVKNHPNPVLLDFFRANKSRQLLNAGIVGGQIRDVIEFIRQIVDFYSLEKNIGIGDMGVFNYIAYTNWADRIRTGRMVCTLFKAFEKDNRVAWFRHK